ncbi:GTP-binding protein Di-Ras2-like [Antechinus flavipes]|uniref:GTP-binding protein Di-Ras2-like n=1 Tax=Antechinus flavipes TaxID=38775 RepID=UPI002236B462|nr:GTP-binding protein Di-Ras2-like [Antechinus flavipes]
MALNPTKPKSSVRLVFFGAAGVGKTALIQRFLADTFESQHKRTVEELHCLEYELDAQQVRVEIMDTSGSYSFPAMRQLGIRRGDAFALVYSLQEPESFQEVRRLRAEILETKGEAPSPPPIVVVGNKSDLAPNGSFPDAVIAAVELEWGGIYLEASAKRGENVLSLFQELLQLAQLPCHLSRLSPALRRRRQTFPVGAPDGTVETVSTSRAVMRKRHSCAVS